MVSAAPRIDRYLERVARRVASELPAGLVVVRGSPAADSDSLAGSLAYAFLLNAEQEGRSGSEAALIVPLLPIPSQELDLRPEVLALLRLAGIKVQTLVDESTLELSALPPERLSVVLVDSDGRDLPPPLLRRVVEILDHHTPVTDLPAAARRTVAPVGSACTLVAEQFFQRLPSLLERRLALLLLGPILLDTVDLDPAAGRVTQRDRRAAERLQALAGAAGDRLYGTLRQARTHLAGLSGTDLLRRDYKESRDGGLRLGIASAPVSAQDWLSRGPDAETCLRRFAEERELTALVMMFAFEQVGRAGQSGGEFRRQLLLLVRGARRYRSLLRFLAGLGLGLRPLPGVPESAGQWALGLFEQSEATFSRKRLEPELRRFCETPREDRRVG